MSAAHTEGLLAVRETRVCLPRNEGGFDISNCPKAVANARRLVACWNACNGVSTERLEDMGRPLMAHLIGCDERAARMVQERGELLVSLKAMLDRYTSLVNCGDAGHWNPETEPDVISARAAIAKVEGEQP